MRFITDKMPQNFLYLGLIARILPKARFIYMKREHRGGGRLTLRGLKRSLAGTGLDNPASWPATR